MTKVSRYPLSAEDLNQYINNLWAAFTLAYTKEDIRSLFRDLCTHTETKMFAKRLEIARRLEKSETYEQIGKDLKVTPGTISKVSNILVEKGNGLRKAVEQINKLEEAAHKREKAHVRNLENPLPRMIKNKNRTIVGTALKIGIKALDKKIMRHIKNKSANKKLEI